MPSSSAPGTRPPKTFRAGRAGGAVQILCLDESGTHGESRRVVVAGLAVPESSLAAAFDAVQAIFNTADAGDRMPQKSTYFTPKLPTGLVLHPLT